MLGPRRSADDLGTFRLGPGVELLTTSVAVEGLVFQVQVPGGLVEAHLVEAGTQVAAFTVLVWALYGGPRGPAPTF